MYWNCVCYTILNQLFFQTQHAILDIPKNAIATGNYGNDTQSLNITWLNKDNTTRNHFIMLFEKNDTENRYMIRNITLSITPTKDVFPDIKGKLKG
jgi:hypothetical protein